MPWEEQPSGEAEWLVASVVELGVPQDRTMRAINHHRPARIARRQVLVAACNLVREVAWQDALETDRIMEVDPIHRAEKANALVLCLLLMAVQHTTHEQHLSVVVEASMPHLRLCSSSSLEVDEGATAIQRA